MTKLTQLENLNLIGQFPVPRDKGIKSRGQTKKSWGGMKKYIQIKISSKHVAISIYILLLYMNFMHAQRLEEAGAYHEVPLDPPMMTTRKWISDNDKDKTFHDADKSSGPSSTIESCGSHHREYTRSLLKKLREYTVNPRAPHDSVLFFYKYIDKRISKKLLDWLYIIKRILHALRSSAFVKGGNGDWISRILLDKAATCRNFSSSSLGTAWISVGECRTRSICPTSCSPLNSGFSWSWQCEWITRKHEVHRIHIWPVCITRLTA